jgi:hypothetical protein
MISGFYISDSKATKNAAMNLAVSFIYKSSDKAKFIKNWLSMPDFSTYLLLNYKEQRFKR